MKLSYERVDIKTLKFDKRNARKHDPRNIKAIKDSLLNFEQQKPIVVTNDGTVIAGNGTLQAAIELGWTDIDIRRSNLSKSKAKAYAITDNRSAELATWDFLELKNQIAELEAEGFNSSDLGFDETNWDILDTNDLSDVDENLDGITATIKVKCPQEIKDEVFIFLKARLLETSFEGVEVV